MKRPGCRGQRRSIGGKGVFDQVVDVVEGDVVDDPLDLEEAGWFAFKKDHESRFDRWTAGLHAGNLFDDNRGVARKFQNRLNPIADLIQRVGGNVHLAPERITPGRGVPIVRSETIFEALGDLIPAQLSTDEHEAIEALLTGGPLASRTPIEQEMHALENKLVRVVAHVKDPLHAQDLRTELGKQITKPPAHLEAIEVARYHNGDCGNVLGVAVIVGVFFCPVAARAGPKKTKTVGISTSALLV